MTDEEKKAIESLIEIREFANLSSYKDVKINQLNAIDIVLNLIEKQSKEIEELKLKIEDEKTFIQLGECIGEKKVNNKIKAKIEEVSNGTFDAKIVLQSLLEKE